MNLETQTQGWKAADVLGVAARWAVGAMFIYTGLNKALDPVGFLKLLRQYHMVTEPWLLNAIAGTLPWFEVFCGLLLVAGIAVRGAAVAVLCMLLPFTAVVSHRALGIADTQGIPFFSVKFDCGCGTGEVFIGRKLLENGLLILLSALVLAGLGQRLCARFNLFVVKRG